MQQNAMQQAMQYYNNLNQTQAMMPGGAGGGPNGVSVPTVQLQTPMPQQQEHAFVIPPGILQALQAGIDGAMHPIHHGQMIYDALIDHIRGGGQHR